MKQNTPNPFNIGDIVYIIGKTALEMTTNKVRLIEAKINHIKHRQFVAYGTNGDYGTWEFSRKHYNKCVFKDKDKATQVFEERITHIKKEN